MKYHKKQALNTNDEHIYDEKVKVIRIERRKKSPASFFEFDKSFPFNVKANYHKIIIVN